uniref:Yeast cell wall synthesis Kre9/Knh1-like N-terminal domain-containing protein n=1 Tax=Phakopsora pachyrhizi TaxID=170000 RepID=A0A0S1MKK6_PHAPC
MFSFILFTLAAAQLASASLYVTFPVKDSTCAVQTPCQVKWQDTNSPPSTSTMGETRLDLVTGDASNLQAVQFIGGVLDPNQATAYTFSPNASLSSKAQYAIRFTPNKNPAGVVFSTYFSITGWIRNIFS